jgi:hypothetical protein
MFELKYIFHGQLTENLLSEIIKIKTAAWPYCYESQKSWIYENLKDSDIHLLLLKDKKVVAYLNLVDIELLIDSYSFLGYGVGNVCAIEKGFGYGAELLKKTNDFIINKKRIGMLFCKLELLNFYNKYDWIKVERGKICLQFNNENIITMILNYSLSFNFISYYGNSF